MLEYWQLQTAQPNDNNAQCLPCVRLHERSSKYIHHIMFNSYNHLSRLSITVPILEMQKLRHREVKVFLQLDTNQVCVTSKSIHFTHQEAWVMLVLPSPMLSAFACGSVAGHSCSIGHCQDSHPASACH